VPLQIAEKAAEVLDLVPEVIEKGSRVAVSDAGMAALLAETALRSAALNVWINLAADKDEARATAHRARLEAALAGRAGQAEALYTTVVDAFGVCISGCLGGPAGGRVGGRGGLVCRTHRRAGVGSAAFAELHIHRATQPVRFVGRLDEPAGKRRRGRLSYWWPQQTGPKVQTTSA